MSENQEYVQSRIELLEKLRKQNLRYRYALHETKTVLKEAIESLSNNEKVNGLEWTIKEINKALDESR